MSPRDQIIQAQPQDANVLSRVIASAFHNLAPSIWLIQDSDARACLFPGYFRLLVHAAMTRGYVYTTTARTAVALWLPVSCDAEPNSTDYDVGLVATTGTYVDRFRLFDELLAKHHPAGLDHDHLAILAVDPDHQHQGIGSALLAEHHRQLDAGGPPRAAYLEASDEQTRQLYLSHGYIDVGEPIVLPAGPCMFPMLRRTNGD